MFNFKKQIRKKSLFAKKELIGIGVLTVCFWAIVLPFLETFTKFVSHDDNIGYFRPLFIEACAQLFNGNLPLWNFYSSVGQPLLGDSQSMALYPVLHVSYLIGGRSDILGAFFIIHIFISLFSMYLFLRSLGIVSFASFLGSVSYATGGAFLSFSRIWITMMPGFSFLPLLFFAHIRPAVQGVGIH